MQQVLRKLHIDEEDLQDLKATLLSITWSNVRPWSEFFERFAAPPMEWAALEKALYTNLVHFAGNYVWVATALALAFFVRSPGTLLLLAVVAAFLVVARAPPKEIAARLAKVLPGNNKRQLAAAGLAAVFLLLTGVFYSLLYLVLVAALLCFLHAALRPPSKKAAVTAFTTDLKAKVHSATDRLSAPAPSSDDMEAGGDAAEFTADTGSFVGDSAPAAHVGAMASAAFGSPVTDLPRPTGRRRPDGKAD